MMWCKLWQYCKQTFYFDVFTDEARENENGVLVHCLAGISRSVTVTVAYLMQKKNISLNQAYDHVKGCKPNISPNFNFMGQLLDFEKSLGCGPSTEKPDEFHCPSPVPVVEKQTVQTWQCQGMTFDSLKLPVTRTTKNKIKNKNKKSQGCHRAL